jgi:hypothetical protein
LLKVTLNVPLARQRLIASILSASIGRSSLTLAAATDFFVPFFAAFFFEVFLEVGFYFFS